MVIVEDHHQIPSAEGVAKSTPKKRRRLVGRQMKQSTPIFELTPRNPHASDRYTGGSSSGPAAIVASGLCSAALGTDGGGSVRIPSSLCGVVGLKTTYGRTNMKGSLCDAGTVEIIGPIAANVEDVMLVYAAVLGSSPSDRISLRSVHAALSEKEKENVCYGLNYDTLSSEVYKHLTQNKKFPSNPAVQTLISPQCNLKSLRGGTDHPNPFIVSSCNFVDIDIKGKKDEACEQILLYARKLDLPAENEKLKANLQGMQWRVAELEILRAKMQNQMTKMLKSRSSSHRNGRSLPRLCS